LFVSILSDSLSELKKESAFCFRSSINKQQQRSFSKENHLFRVSLLGGWIFGVNCVWFSVRSKEEPVFFSRSPINKQTTTTAAAAALFPVNLGGCLCQLCLVLCQK
jgi:hypothetical protein